MTDKRLNGLATLGWLGQAHGTDGWEPKSDPKDIEKIDEFAPE
jgi:hypothetical protein